MSRSYCSIARTAAIGTAPTATATTTTAARCGMSLRLLPAAGARQRCIWRPEVPAEATRSRSSDGQGKAQSMLLTQNTDRRDGLQCRGAVAGARLLDGNRGKRPLHVARLLQLP